MTAECVSPVLLARKVGMCMGEKGGDMREVREGARQTLLIGIEGFGEDVVASKDHDDGEVLVDEGQDAVFELAGHDGFAVEVGDFFDFEGACMHTTISESYFATKHWSARTYLPEQWRTGSLVPEAASSSGS